MCAGACASTRRVACVAAMRWQADWPPRIDVVVRKRSRLTMCAEYHGRRTVCGMAAAPCANHAAREDDMKTIDRSQLECVFGGMNAQMWNAMQHAVEMGLNVHWIN